MTSSFRADFIAAVINLRDSSYVFADFMTINSISTSDIAPKIGLIRSLREAATCMLLGIRSALALRAILFSISLWIVAIGLWSALFFAFREEVTQLATAAAALVVFGLAIFFPGLAPGSSGVAGGGVGMAIAAMSTFALSWLAVALAYAFAVLITARVLAELFLMGRVQKHALEFYPDLAAMAAPSGAFNKVSFGIWIRPWAALLLLGPLCLLLPVIGGAFLFVLLSYLNSRFLVNDAADNIASSAEVQHFIKANRIELMALGILATLLNFVPLFGLLSPWATGSAVCHLTMRHLIRLSTRTPCRVNPGSAQ
ncbi:MAG TPA: hypothetical protein DHV59_18300 [Oxalobacteraceae bacterium]|nr:hypothetical protein [Oxalobacteraceae bacterium]